jgi:hypothetical protein
MLEPTDDLPMRAWSRTLGQDGGVDENHVRV